MIIDYSKLTIENVIHCYLGQEFIFTFKNGEKVKGLLEQITDHGFICGDGEWSDGTKDWYEIMDYRTDGLMQLILYEAHSMDAIDRKAYKELCTKVFDKNILVDTPQSILFLFHRGIDAFDLIEKGLAIKKNNYNKYPGFK